MCVCEGGGECAAVISKISTNVALFSRATQGAICSADRPSVAGSDVRASDGTAQSDVADSVRHFGMSAAESRQFT